MKKSDPSVTDRTVFITGCSSGIGHSTAQAFAARGYRVVATARKTEDLKDLDSLGRDRSWSLKAVQCDVSDDASIRSAIEFAHQAFGGIQILVNNAGYGLMGPVEMVPLSEARRQLEVNVLGAMRLVQLVLPDMRENRWGRIINISSTAGRIAIPFGAWYSASKFALEGLSASMRLELAPFGIHTICIEPGPVETEFMLNTKVPQSEAVMPPWYRVLYRTYTRRRDGIRPFAIRADEVADVIVKAAEAKYPYARYTMTIPGRAGVIAQRFLPDRLMDLVVRTFYSLRGLQHQSETNPNE